MSKKRARPDPPSLWIIAGANGSGKTTAYGRLTIEAPRGSIWIINPDDLALRIRQAEKRDAAAANLEAVKRIEKWLYASVEAYQTVGVETVLSTDKYRKLVEKAKQRGFTIRLLYVYLADAALNIQRVATRVKKGGHDVPEDKITSRRARSLAQLPWFFVQADQAIVFDNSGAEPAVKARKSAAGVEIFGDLPEEIRAAVAGGAA